jgi:hypothetical protein
MKAISLLFSFMVMLTLSGCMQTSPAVAQKIVPMPEWVNAVLPNDTPYTMYGMAIAKNRELATKAALSDMVSRLGVNIESTYESVEKSSSYHTSLKVQNSIKSEISKIKINNYKVIKSHRISYREFAVMVQSDKQKFVSGLKSDLTAKRSSLTQRESTLKGVDSFRKYRAKKLLMEDAKRLVPTILMIQQLDGSYEQQKDMDFVAEKEKSFLEESRKLKFFVSGDEKSQAFITVLKNDLTSHGFSVSNSASNAVIVQLKTTDNLNRDVNIAVLTLNISVYDKKSQIGGKTIIMKERYNGSKRSVYKNAAIHLEEDIKSDDLEFYQSLTP